MERLTIPMDVLAKLSKLPKLDLSPEELAQKSAENKAQSYNDVVGNLTGYDCKKCKNRGYIMQIRDDWSIYTVECDCMRIRRCVWRMESSGLRNIIRKYTFDAFSAETDWQKKVKSDAKTYAKNLNGWFLICGQSGCGKTHLCTAICRERLLSGDEVLFMPWVDDCTRIKSRATETDRDDLFNPLKNAQILYIDDFFKIGGNFGEEDSGQPSRADIRIAYELLNQRYINHMPTIISTEMMPEELLAVDEALGGRIIEMAGENIYRIDRDTSKNYRLRRIKSF